MAGKGSKPRPYNKKKYDKCPLWENIKKEKKKNEGTSGIRRKT